MSEIQGIPPRRGDVNRAVPGEKAEKPPTGKAAPSPSRLSFAETLAKEFEKTLGQS